MVDLKALVPWRGGKAQTPALREEYFDPFATFRREMDRMFDDFFGARAATTNWQALTPAIGIDETDGEFIITAELPGVTEKDIEVTFAGDMLTIKGEKKSEAERRNGDGYYMERRFGSFARTVRLPFDAKDSDTEAKFKDGVLTIQIPKPSELQKAVRRIAVKAE
jgi:HSP20 family protein